MAPKATEGTEAGVATCPPRLTELQKIAEEASAGVQAPDMPSESTRTHHTQALEVDVLKEGNEVLRGDLRDERVKTKGEEGVKGGFGNGGRRKKGKMRGSKKAEPVMGRQT